MRVGRETVIRKQVSAGYNSSWTMLEWICAVRDLLGEIDKLRDILGPGYHVFETTDGDWSLQHPVECHPNMLDCEVHRAFMRLGAPEVEDGRYRVELSASGGLSYEKVRKRA